MNPPLNRYLPALTLAAICCLAFVSLAQSPKVDSSVPLGLDPVKIPDDNPMSAAKIALGKQLYFDKRLSEDNTISCASCHDPAKGWSNGDQFATGIKGQKGGRNSPTILNSAYNYFQFWDGRAGSLEEQALGPIQNPIEMGIPSLDFLEKKLNKIKGYRSQFTKVFGSETIRSADIGKAIAAFERTVLTGDAPYDRYKAGDKNAMSAEAIRGMDVFFNQAHCSACHAGPNFTDRSFHNVGVGIKKKGMDIGREEISKLEGDRASFKTPTLRDIAMSGPYMHDGSMKTLKEVLDHYNDGAVKNPQLDEEIYPLNLTKKQLSDLLVFLREGLSSKSYPMITPPELPK